MSDNNIRTYDNKIGFRYKVTHLFYSVVVPVNINDDDKNTDISLIFIAVQCSKSKFTG